jgi:hypothetical protein
MKDHQLGGGPEVEKLIDAQKMQVREELSATGVG